MILALALASCAAGDVGPDTASTTPSTQDVPIGSYLSGDRATEARIFDMMRTRGIAVTAYGSLGYTVAVPASRAAEARALLADAIEHGLRAGLLDEHVE